MTDVCADCSGSGSLPDMSCCPRCGGGGLVFVKPVAPDDTPPLDFDYRYRHDAVFHASVDTVAHNVAASPADDELSMKAIRFQAAREAIRQWCSR